ncbi:peptidylprolyl isomerase [Sulfurimonas marina]|uniref:Peptidyl-prolyl cis-trans isomerase n=1 Tax=Sulfurimonas marina TaxID=2590551 RepID=A0A7M3V9A0_9BACT|nr:peptidylprolyl isomerase [Sulfurimonas marina]QOP40333.1 peptidyl-prolyl cis-trans isomerase [Sulfurimonas marina]
MINITKKIFYEPLLHFLLLGAIAYFYFDYSQDVQTTISKPTLTLQHYELENLQNTTQLETKKLVFEYLTYQKILLAEAYSLGLYKENPEIDNLLLEKMEYLFKNDTQFQEPSEEQLKKFYQEHLNDYSKVNSLDLYIFTFNENIEKNVIKILPTITDLRPYAKKYKQLTPNSIKEKFGSYIALKLSTLPEGFWSEAIENKLFFITNKQVSTPYPFEEVEGIVYENYKKSFQVKNEKEEYAKLFNKYIIKEQK